MSRVLERRLEKVEAAIGPKVLGYMQCIYATNMQDYQRQKADLVASGQAKAADFFVDMNYRHPAYENVVKAPETIPWTETHDERVIRMAKENAP